MNQFGNDDRGDGVVTERHACCTEVLRQQMDRPVRCDLRRTLQADQCLEEVHSVRLVLPPIQARHKAWPCRIVFGIEASEYIDITHREMVLRPQSFMSSVWQFW